jgi:hypothetical protein
MIKLNDGFEIFLMNNMIYIASLSVLFCDFCRGELSMNNLLINASDLYSNLFQVDKELADKTREKGCPHCGGTLHSANYPRQLKGCGLLTVDTKIIRFSFCCATDGCRRRVTPPSVRFFGRKRYMAMVLVLISSILHKLTRQGAKELKKLAGVSYRTLFRWKAWWQNSFSITQFWKYNKAFYMPPLSTDRLCSDLVESFTANNEVTGMMRLLKFLSPLSCSNKIQVI